LASGWIAVAPPLPPYAFFKRPRRQLPFPLEEETHRIFARARHGLFRGLQALALGAHDEVLAPAYHHGSEIETLRQAGLHCRFYDCNDELAPSEQELTALVTTRTRALYLIHYLGFPQDSARWRRWCDRYGLMLLEDAAQSWLATHHESRAVGSYGDLAIYCLHKSFGLPDGGALVVRGDAAPPLTRRGLGAHRLLVKHAEWLAQRHPLAGRMREHERFAHLEPELPERAFALGLADSAPLAATTFLIPRVSDATAAERRRANSEQLLALLGDHVRGPFRTIPSGSSPYVFPVSTSGKADILEHLASNRIVGGRLWETPHPDLDAGAFPKAAELRSTLVGLPVHQELTPADVRRVASVYLRGPQPAAGEAVGTRSAGALRPAR
jgi:selenocysteine lyase/cysteine desulfurase